MLDYYRVGAGVYYCNPGARWSASAAGLLIETLKLRQATVLNKIRHLVIVPAEPMLLLIFCINIAKVLLPCRYQREWLTALSMIPRKEIGPNSVAKAQCKHCLVRTGSLANLLERFLFRSVACYSSQR